LLVKNSKVLKMNIRKTRGFTLLETLIAATILSVSAVAGVAVYQEQLQDELDQQAVKTADNVVASYKRFRTHNRRNPNNINELLASEHFSGAGVLPWGSGLAGAPNASGRAYNLSFPTESPAQAARIADLLSKYDAVSAGSIVSFNAPMSTIETVSNQMLCREEIPGVPECNKMSVNLDVNENDLNQINELDADIAEFDELIAEVVTTDTLDVTDRITLGSNTISYSGNNLQINAGTTGFGGDLVINGDIVGNNSNISGVDTLTGKNIVTDGLQAVDGQIETLNGTSLDYDTGSIDNLTTTTLYSDLANFVEATADTVNSTTTNATNFNGGVGNFVLADIADANGDNLNLSGNLDSNTFTSSTSSLGSASADSMNVAGRVTAAEIVGGPATLSSVMSSGNVSGNYFTGNNFTTGISSVNNNYALIEDNIAEINQNINNINANAANISQNANDLSSLRLVVNQNTADIADNRSDNINNASAASSNASRISSNSSAISSNTNSVNRIDAAVAALSARWAQCVSVGGCQ
jgi:prepilin-type N-terminal cleavage/methylation domain-containing protein